MSNRSIIVIRVMHSPNEVDVWKKITQGKDNTILEKRINGFWQKISGYVKSLEINFNNTNVYQDSLPNYSSELLSEYHASIHIGSFSPNAKLLKWLKDKGARIIGTEDPELLLKEIERDREFLKSFDELGLKAVRLNDHQEIEKNSIEERDRYIGRRINDTLENTGILFIGGFHNVIPYLDNTIQIKDPEIIQNSFPEFFGNPLLERYTRRKEIV